MRRTAATVWLASLTTLLVTTGVLAVDATPIRALQNAPPSCPELRRDIVINGNATRSVTLLTLEECCTECELDPDCAAFTYIPFKVRTSVGLCSISASLESGWSIGYGAITGTMRPVVVPPEPTPDPAWLPIEVHVYASGEGPALLDSEFSACKTKCQESASCAVFSFVPYVNVTMPGSRGRCYLLTAESGYRVSSVAAVTGVKSWPEPIPQVCPPLDLNVKVNGTTLRQIRDIEVAQCCEECGANPQCDAFWFSPDGNSVLTPGLCNLVSDLTDARSSPTTISSGVMRALPRPPQDVCPPLEENWLITRIGYRFVRDSDLTRCCAECRNDEDCGAFSFVPYTFSETTGMCHLAYKGGFALLPERRLVYGAVSGIVDPRVTFPPLTPVPTRPPTPQPTSPTPTTVEPSTAPPPPATTLPPPTPPPATTLPPPTAPPETSSPPPPSTSRPPPLPQPICPRFEGNVDFYGNDLYSIANVDRVDCCEACNKEPLCMAFTFVPSTFTCYLKSSDSGRRPSVGLFSGVKSVAECPRLFDNVDLFGNDLYAVNDVDQNGCCAACNSEPTCLVFSFVPSPSSSPSTGTCYLKSSPAGFTITVGVQSGAKIAPVCPQLEANVDYYGNDIRIVADVDLSECCKQCNAELACKAFTYVPQAAPSTKGACYLKTSSDGKKSVAGAFSAVKGRL